LKKQAPDSLGSGKNPGFLAYRIPPSLTVRIVQHRKPYAVRYSFARWALAVDIHTNRLIELMGRESKQIACETYGKYVDGLEKDVPQIREYLGVDFRRKRPVSASARAA